MADLERERAGFGRRSETVGCLVDEHPEVHRLMMRRALQGVEAGQPEESLDEPAHPTRLPLDAFEGVRYQATSRSAASARLALASMTESGVRSSWEASAVNAS
jgi:hypothetical protein